jgi:hypothetical protein
MRSNSSVGFSIFRVILGPSGESKRVTVVPSLPTSLTSLGTTIGWPPALPTSWLHVVCCKYLKIINAKGNSHFQEIHVLFLHVNIDLHSTPLNTCTYTIVMKQYIPFTIKFLLQYLYASNMIHITHETNSNILQRFSHKF